MRVSEGSGHAESNDDPHIMAGRVQSPSPPVIDLEFGANRLRVIEHSGPTDSHTPDPRVIERIGTVAGGFGFLHMTPTDYAALEQTQSTGATRIGRFLSR